MEVELWRKVTNLEVSKRASALVLQMESTSGDLCLALGNGKFLEPAGAGMVQTVLEIICLRMSCAVLSLEPDVVRFLHLKKATQTMDAHRAKFDLLRRKAGSRRQPGGTFPEDSVAVLCLENASLSRQAKTLVLASTRGHLGIVEIAQQARRLFGPIGCGGRQGILFVDAGGKEELSPIGRQDFEVWAACRKAQEKLKGE